MRRTSSVTWLIFGSCAAALVAVVAWLSWHLVALEEQEARARYETERQIALGEALWRMDSWLAPQLAYETARPHFEYRPFYPQNQSYTRILNRIEPGEVLVPSPLLSFRSPVFELHFELAPGGELSSPQLPRGNYRDLAEGSLEVGLDDERHRTRLAELRRCLDSEDVDLATIYDRLSDQVELPDPPPTNPYGNDYVLRQRQAREAKANATKSRNWNIGPPAEHERVVLGPFLPLWLGNGDESRRLLVFVRRVLQGVSARYQGVLVDWPKLKGALLSQARAEPRHQHMRFSLHAHEAGSTRNPSEAESRQLLATVPAKLELSFVRPVLALGKESVLVLSIVWGGLLLSLCAVAFAIRSTIRLGERRARFASAVTHELRTPLTTFRMYSEMLADDLVTEPEKRREYLRTLESESVRLSRLVENVLSYARIEEGRFTARPENIGLQELIERVEPVLLRRAEDAGMPIAVHVENGVSLHVDVEAVTQILFNLVDNACKYAKGSEASGIDLRASRRGDRVRIEVADHGPGIADVHREAIFRPFERQSLRADDVKKPGVGLGLALARALARDLGGDLRLQPSRGQGACFVLVLPARD